MSSDALSTVTRASSKERAQPPVRARLRVVHPTRMEWSLTLSPDPTTLGRTASEEVTTELHHATVSRRHMRITWDAARGLHVGQDLGSHNGSRLSGVTMGTEPHLLDSGCVVQLGDVLLVYEQFPPDDAASDDDPIIPGRAPAMVMLRQRIERAAPDPSPVLLLGETGTGKEHIARELHRRSERPGPFVAINCSALSPQIIDSQLFGHIKGAFTGATKDQPGLFRAADGGTLFLDEIGDLPLALQPKLLRALQEGEVQPVGSAKLLPVDVRVIAATHADLVDRVEAAEFRRDLYARLALWELRVPPLRDRRGDVLAWLMRLHKDWLDARPDQIAAPLELSAEAAERLLLHDWPSNLREIDRLVHDLASNPQLPRPIGPQHLPAWLEPSETRPATATVATPSPTLSAHKPPVPTREQFVAAFEELEGNVRAMARRFGRDRRQIYRWIEAHGLTEHRPKRP